MPLTEYRQDVVSSYPLFACFSILLYNDCMSNKYTQLRIWRETLQPLRMLHALTGESQIELIDRLARQELERIQNATHQNIQVQVVSLEKE